jgi:hypothetical protein
MKKAIGKSLLVANSGLLASIGITSREAPDI